MNGEGDNTTPYLQTLHDAVLRVPGVGPTAETPAARHHAVSGATGTSGGATGATGATGTRLPHVCVLRGDFPHLPLLERGKRALLLLAPPIGPLGVLRPQGCRLRGVVRAELPRHWVGVMEKRDAAPGGAGAE